MISKNNFFILLLCFFTISCSGTFATDKTLSEKYWNEYGDKELSIFITPLKNTLEVAVKNVGYSFMTNLRVGFECVKTNKTVTEIYNIGNLKAYFSKQFTVPLNFHECKSLSAGYYFIPASDGGLGYSDRNFINPVNSVENTFKLK